MYKYTHIHKQQKQTQYTMYTRTHTHYTMYTRTHTHYTMYAQTYTHTCTRTHLWYGWIYFHYLPCFGNGSELVSFIAGQGKQISDVIGC